MDFGTETVVVPRRLLGEILEDGICPLHLRIEIQRLLSPFQGGQPQKEDVRRFASRVERLRKPEQLPEEPQQQQEPANEPADEPVEEAGGETEAESAVRPAEVPARPAVEDTQVVEARRLDHEECLQKQKLQLKWAELPLDPPCLVLVVCGLPLAEVLALRAVSSSALQWAMTGAIAHLGEVCKAHHRIRTRLWIQRLEEINRNTAEESVYDSKVRRLADDALRRRMEAEMADARQDMENRIRDFHVEVDRRMEAQAVRVHAIVEERVQQQLDTILVAEMEKVRVMVEERVQGRVRQVVQREVYATVCEMQAKLATLAQENEKLRTVFMEHMDHSDLCFRSLVWALGPHSTGLFARTLRLIWCCRRRFTRVSAWMLGVPGVPIDRRRDVLRARLELMQHAGALRAENASGGSSGGAGSSSGREGRQKLMAALQGAAEAVESSRTEDTSVATPNPAAAARDLQRTAEELVAAALGARQSLSQVQLENREEPPRQRHSSQDSISEARLTDLPSEEDDPLDSEDRRELLAEGVIEDPQDLVAAGVMEAHLVDPSLEDTDSFEEAEEGEEFFDVQATGLAN